MIYNTSDMADGELELAAMMGTITHPCRREEDALCHEDAQRWFVCYKSDLNYL